MSRHHRNSINAFPLSPKRRHSILGGNNPSNPATPLQGQSKDGTPEPVFLEALENNDEAEKRLRQLNRLQQKHAKNLSSPANTTSDRRTSLGVVHSLTNQQLSEHYSKCLQLSTENKINIKNAFNLQLIDYMTEMLKRKDSDMKNFQVASLTLDASTKIYAYRVDSIHTDTLKMAGGLGRTTQENAEGGDEATDQLGILGARKKKKVKRTSRIETNLKNINISQFDVDYEVDPLFKKQTSMYDESRSSAGMFLNSLNIQDDSCQMILDSTTVITDHVKETKEEHVNASIPSLPDLSSKLICPTLVPFKFISWKVSDEDSFCDVSRLKKDDPPVSSIDDKHAFDMNAVPEPLEEEPFESFGVNDDIGADDDAGYDAEGTVITVGGGGCHQRPRPAPPLMETIHLKDHLANVPLEYSYFDTKVMSAWAGPGHWRMKPLSKESSKVGVNKVVRKKKENIILNYAVTFEEIEKLFTARQSTKLSYNTVKLWTKDKTTLPVDLHYDNNKFTKLYGNPSIVVRKQLNTITECDDINEYNYNNKTDVEDYCPDMDDPADNYGDGDQLNNPNDVTDVFGMTCLESQPFSGANDTKTSAFTGENLVAAPNKVAKININYAVIAKKMDMKKLKSFMWSTLTDSSENKENDKRNENQMRPLLPDSDQDKTEMDDGYSTTFCKLFGDLRPKLPVKMSENLSIPLAFIALLHLANEHNLRMESIEELGDFAITQD